ncbi:MAG: TraR/DksA family transcriptional regulator [Halioglobus sp.]
MAYEALRAQLEESLATLQDRMQKVRKDVTREHSDDSAEQAQERENDEVIDAIGNETALSVRLIRSALDRMDDGTYGQCEQCGEDIATDRLQVVPEADRCVRCAS